LFDLLTTIKATALQFLAVWCWPRLAKLARRSTVTLRNLKLVEEHVTRQLLIDVSIIASHDARTGIQRVVRSLILGLLESPPPGFEIKLVRASRKRSYCYANSYLASLTSSEQYIEDVPVVVSNGDMFLGLDLTSRISPRRYVDFLKWRAQGVLCAFVVYDLLPIFHPEWFTPRAQRSFRSWLSLLAIHADALFCISESVAVEVRECMQKRFRFSEGEVVTKSFHLGAQLPEKDSTERPQPGGTTILMVGTIEPRKGHAQVLDAFECIWRSGVDATLIIAGQPGWHMEDFAQRLRCHSETDKRLQWFANADDPQLAKLYARANGVIMASQAEGFGLPLIEAAQYGIPILARDLPVFREVAGDHVTYFVSADGGEFAPQLTLWVEQLLSGTAIPSHAMKTLTWRDSTEQLKTLITQLARQQVVQTNR
jgi:glycosyltransferase involved in cell wall biosynthesis